MDDLISRKAMLSKVAELRFRAEVKDRDGNVHNVTDLVRKCLADLVLDAPAVHYTPYTDIAPITEDRPPDGPYRGVLDVDSGVVTVEYPLPDLVEVVRCRDCTRKIHTTCYFMDDFDPDGFCHRGTREEPDEAHWMPLPGAYEEEDPT